MDALFACTKCAKRFPFEDLSEADQLCKECRNNFPIVKCTYCRVEFQQEDKNSVHSICRKCAHNVKVYGKPRACEYCSIIAAFIGNRCQRCANSEKKWGQPKMCDQCKQQCAFERGTDSRRKVSRAEGKQLCWLCTMAYKRVLAKALRNNDVRVGTPTSKSVTPQDKSQDNTPYSPGNTTPYSPGSGFLKSAGSSTKSEGTNEAVAKSSSSKDGKDKNKENNKARLTSGNSTKEREKKDREGAASGKHKAESDSRNKEGNEAKKPKLEKSANGSAPSSKSGSAGAGDINSSETVVIVTQLKEELEALKKQVTIKDKQILVGEKKITELKAENSDSESKLRLKVASMAKLHQDKMETLQTKNRELMRQIAQLQKKLPKEKKSSIVSAAPAADS